jgi:multidrug efflux system membrane fusion protein
MPTLLTSIVTLDPIYIYFDVDEATYLKNNRLWFEGKRPSSRDTPNPGAGDADRRNKTVA